MIFTKFRVSTSRHVPSEGKRCSQDNLLCVLVFFLYVFDDKMYQVLEFVAYSGVEISASGWI